MANNNSRSQPRRYESYNTAGVCATSILQLLGGFGVIGLGVYAYIIEGRLKYYGIPLWGGALFCFTAVLGFASACRKTACGISTYMFSSVLTTALAAGLLVLFARLLSLDGRYYYCDRRDSLSLACVHYADLNNLMIVEACSLGVFALVFTTGAVGVGLCACGLCRKRGRTAAGGGGSQNNIVVTEAAVNFNAFAMDMAVPTAPPEYIVAEEELHGNTTT